MKDLEQGPHRTGGTHQKCELGFIVKSKLTWKEKDQVQGTSLNWGGGVGRGKEEGERSVMWQLLRSSGATLSSGMGVWSFM